MAVSESRGGTRIEIGTVHPEDPVVLSQLAYIATSDFPLDRSSVRERPEEEPRVSIVESFHVARRSRAHRCLSPFTFRARFSHNSLLSITLSSLFNISESFRVVRKRFTIMFVNVNVLL